MSEPRYPTHLNQVEHLFKTRSTLIDWIFWTVVANAMLFLFFLLVDGPLASFMVLLFWMGVNVMVVGSFCALWYSDPMAEERWLGGMFYVFLWRQQARVTDDPEIYDYPIADVVVEVEMPSWASEDSFPTGYVVKQPRGHHWQRVEYGYWWYKQSSYPYGYYKELELRLTDIYGNSRKVASVEEALFTIRTQASWRMAA